MSLQEPDLAAFEKAVRAYVTQIAAAPEDAASLLAEMFHHLTSADLPVDELARRARRIAESLPAGRSVQLAAATAAQDAGPAIRAAVVAVLPPDLQRTAYAVPEPEPDIQAGDDDQPAEIEEAVPDTASAEAADEPAIIHAEPAEDWRTVLLLGTRDEVEGNARFLAARDFEAIRVSTVEQLATVSRERCCGLVVHAGWWQQLSNAEAVIGFVKQQLTQSNLLYYRLDSDAIGDAAGGLATLLDSFDSSVRARVQTGAGSDLTDFDMAQLTKVAGLLESADTASIQVEGVSDEERRLLTAAVALFDREVRGLPAISPEDIAVRPIVEGRSAARVLRVKVAGRQSVFVAKLDEMCPLQWEVERARRVAPPSQPVQMRLYSLAGRAVLIQQLVANLDNPIEDAPSLRERLAARSAWERGRRSDTEPRLDDLLVGVERLVKMVAEVNAGSEAGLDTHSWMTVEPLQYLADLGVRWSIETDGKPFDPSDVLPWVETKLDELKTACLVHGDLHTGNVLMLDDRTPRLIDFALAGAGHPCFDLVRVSSAIIYSSLRPVVSEQEMRRFFARAHVDRVDAEPLCIEFPAITAGASAELSAKALCMARGAAFQLLEHYGQGEEHYLATVFLVAAQSLTMDEFQGAIVRPALGALQPRIEELRG